jgi:nucleotide-binding universal stress UspA family protein
VREQPAVQVTAWLQDYLRGCAAELGGAETACVVDEAEDPAGVIVTLARQQHADLIAIATHGRTGRLGRLAGRATARVIRSGVAPVVVLRP